MGLPVNALRCKPGDMAFVIQSVRSDCEAPAIVFVMKAAPVGDHILPDGQRAWTGESGSWVCESQGRDFKVPMGHGGHRKCRFAVIDDRGLRPIRPSAEPESTETREELTA